MWQKFIQDVETLMLTPVTLRKTIVTVDYPKQLETITAPTYTFRFTIRGIPESVDVAINRGAWESCRVSEKNWWYDWAHYTTGNYQMVIRATMPNGKIYLSSIRRFQVQLPE